MIYVKQNQDLYEIKFRYDPELIQLVKNVPGRQWDSVNKMWTIPRARLGFLINQLKDTVYEPQLHVESDEDIDVNATFDDSSNVPEIDISDVEWQIQEGFKPFPHQTDSIKYDKWRNEHGLRSGFILADQPGLGKTNTVMNIALYHKQRYGSKHCLVIACVNSAKYNWRDDIIKHSNGKIVPYILGTRLRKDKVSENYNTGGKQKFEDLTQMTMYGVPKEKGGQPLPYFLIINIEAIGRTKVGRTRVITQRLIEMINNGDIGVIALDEIHKGASPSSDQGKQLLEIKKKITKQVEWIPMTGTPITSKPTDVFLPLKLVDGHTFSSYYTWCDEFCIFGRFGRSDIIGYRNIPRLKTMLQSNMLRRLKDKVLDLPPKIRHTEYIENTSYQRDLYNKCLTQLAEMKATIQQKAASVGSVAFKEILMLRQVNGSPELVDPELSVDKNYLSKNAKLSRLLELIQEIVANDEKVVVFSNWVEPLRTVYKYVSAKYKTCCYTGTMSGEDREKHKRVFINNPEYKVMLGTVGALGVSHTLTVARNVIFYDSPWNPSDVEQCEDRCHRAGTTQSINVYTLIVKDSVDEIVHNILSKKEGTANYIVDNELDLKSHPELLDIIIDQKN